MQLPMAPTLPQQLNPSLQGTTAAPSTLQQHRLQYHLLVAHKLRLRPMQQMLVTQTSTSQMVAGSALSVKTTTSVAAQSATDARN
jgi:hypothetical protein